LIKEIQRVRIVRLDLRSDLERQAIGNSYDLNKKRPAGKQTFLLP